MKLVRFVRDFEFRELIDRKHCVLCKVLGLKAYKAAPSPISVPDETAKAAIEAGAAVEVSD